MSENTVDQTVLRLLSTLSPTLAGSRADMASPLDDLGFDSLSILDLLFSIEDALHITLSDDALLYQDDWMESVGAFVEFVQSRVSASTP